MTHQEGIAGVGSYNPDGMMDSNLSRKKIVKPVYYQASTRHGHVGNSKQTVTYTNYQVRELIERIHYTAAKTSAP
jgi:hypothetical protein